MADQFVPSDEDLRTCTAHAQELSALNMSPFSLEIDDLGSAPEVSDDDDKFVEASSQISRGSDTYRTCDVIPDATPVQEAPVRGLDADEEVGARSPLSIASTATLLANNLQYAADDGDADVFAMCATPAPDDDMDRDSLEELLQTASTDYYRLATEDLTPSPASHSLPNFSQGDGASPQ